MIKEFKTSSELERMIVHQLNYLGFSSVDAVTIVGRSENWKVSSFCAGADDHALIAHLIPPIVKRMQSRFEIMDSTLVPLFEPSLEGMAVAVA